MKKRMNKKLLLTSLLALLPLFSVSAVAQKKPRTEKAPASVPAAPPSSVAPSVQEDGCTVRETPGWEQIVEEGKVNGFEAAANISAGATYMRDSPDYAMALQHFRPAAEAGHPSARFALGGMYLYGQGVEKNSAVAVEWFSAAAAQGNASAQYWLARMCLAGNGVSRNPDAGRAWMHKAAAQGHAQALEWLSQNTAAPQGR